MAKTKECTRCCGTGEVGNFAHVKAGVCFACNGTGRRVVMKRVTVDGFAVIYDGVGLLRETRTEAEALAEKFPNSRIEPRQFKKSVPA